MVNAAQRTISEVDVILWLVEPTTYIGAGERHIIEQLKKTNTPVILVINKIDTVKKEEILAFIEAYRHELDFAEVVPVSALKKKNTETLIIIKYKNSTRLKIKLKNGKIIQIKVSTKVKVKAISKIGTQIKLMTNERIFNFV